MGRKHQFKLYVTSAPPAPTMHALQRWFTNTLPGVEMAYLRHFYGQEAGQALVTSGAFVHELKYHGFRDLDHPVLPVGSCESLLPAVLSSWKKILAAGPGCTWCMWADGTEFRILNPEAMSQRPDELPRETWVRARITPPPPPTPT